LQCVSVRKYIMDKWLLFCKILDWTIFYR